MFSFSVYKEKRVWPFSEVAVTYQAGRVRLLWEIRATRIKEKTEQAEGWEMRECML